MARPRKVRPEGAETTVTAVRVPDPVPGDNGAALARIVEYFKATFPEKWEELALCPLQHGVETMAELLKD